MYMLHLVLLYEVLMFYERILWNKKIIPAIFILYTTLQRTQGNPAPAASILGFSWCNFGSQRQIY